MLSLIRHRFEWNRFYGGGSVLLIGLLFSACLHYLLGMDAFWDTANYHFYIGWAASRSLHYDFGAVAQFHTYLNPLIDLVNYYTFSVHSYFGAALHSLAFALAAYFVFMLSRLCLDGEYLDKAGILAAVIIGSTGAMTISLFGSWTNENITAVFILAGIYLMMRGLGTNASSYFFGAGIVFGCALGLKLSAGHYVVGALAATVASTRFDAHKTIFFCIGTLGGFLLIDGTYMYLRWVTVDNPFFPIANNIFKSPYFPDTWKSFGQFEISKIIYYLSLPFVWLSSGDFSEEPSIRDGRFLLAYIGIGAALLADCRKWKLRKNEVALIVFFLTSFVAWLLAFRTYRYLVGLEMLSGLVFVLGLRKIIGPEKISISRFAFFFGFAFLCLVTVYPNWGRRPWSGDFVSTNITDLLNNKRPAVVFFADQRTSYLAPQLYTKGVLFANLYSQKWWDGARASSLEDPDNSLDPGSIEFDQIKDVYFLQYSRLDPRSKSKYLSKMFAGRYYDCEEISTNMPSNPYLCSFRDVADMPVADLGTTYTPDANEIIFLDGWSYAEFAHRWTDGKQASLLVKAKGAGLCRHLVRIDGTTLGSQSLQVDIDGSVVFSGQVSGHISLKLERKFNVNERGNLIKINFFLPDAKRPGNGDPRTLGFSLSSLKIDCENSGI